jgi:O-antigen ligase
MKLQSVLPAFLAAAVMTVWVRERWSASILEAAAFLLTACVVAGDALRDRGWRPPPAAAVPAALAAWGCAQIALRTTVAPAATRDAALYWLAAACMVFLGRRACSTPEGRERVLQGTLSAGGAICLLGTVQLFTSRGLVLWLFPSGYETRVIGPFTSPNNYAAFAELLLPLALAFGLRARHGSAWLIAAAGLFASVLASASRAGVALAALEVAAVFLLFRSRHRETPGARRSFLAFASLAAIFTLVVGYQFVWQRFAESDDPLSLRREFLESSIAMVRAQPWYGFGLGTWAAVYPRFALRDPGVDANHAHNEWAQWAAEGGVPALVLMLALAAWTVRPALRSVWGVGLLSVLLHALVDYPFLRFGLAAWIFFLLGSLSSYVPDRGPRRRPSRIALVPSTAIVLVLLAAAFAGGRSARAGLLFRQGTPDALREAARLDPGQAEYHAALARLDTGRSVEHLERALAANPYLTRARISLANRMEASGDYEGAAAMLLDAERHDRLYAPALALANFYYRRQQEGNFWIWARRAASLSYDEATPLFDLCFAIDQDAAAVRGRLDAGPRVNRKLFAYLLARRSPADLSGEARTMAAAASLDDRPVLLDYADRSLAVGRTDAAAEVWTLLSFRGLVAGAKGPASALSNGDFREPITGRGFDWRVHPVSGVSPERQTIDGAPALAIAFSGRQPETCDVLSQYLRPQSGGARVFEFEYRTHDLPVETGLAWSIAGRSVIPLAASRAWTTARGEVRPVHPPGRLTLRYTRAPGTTRAEGVVFLRNVRLVEPPVPLRSAARY